MTQYKVPQDVEADDKLIGPFSFRQFIYLVIVIMCIMLAWGLWQLFIPLVIIPVPIIIFFGALALPLRKDQPMEIYMAAIVQFNLKPRRRLWDPDGIESLIEITVPKTVEIQRTKDISQTEAERRFGYLAEIVDTQGWAVRGPGIQAPNSAMNTEVYFAAQSVPDVLDTDSSQTQALNDKIDQSEATRKQNMIDIMNGEVAAAAAPAPEPVIVPEPAAMPAPEITQEAMPVNTNTTNSVSIVPSADLTDEFGSVISIDPVTVDNPITGQPLEYNPYPEIQQAMIQPISTKKAALKLTPTTSEKVVSPDIINLASNSDLSIATIAGQANRINNKQDSDKEVFISLR